MYPAIALGFALNCLGAYNGNYKLDGGGANSLPFSTRDVSRKISERSQKKTPYSVGAKCLPLNCCMERDFFILLTFEVDMKELKIKFIFN